MKIKGIRQTSLRAAVCIALAMLCACGGASTTIDVPANGKNWWPPEQPRQPQRLALASPGLTDPQQWWAANILSQVPADAYRTSGQKDFCSQMIIEVNATRARYGLAPVEPLPILNRVAQAHAHDQAVRDYWSHKTPEGLGSHARILAAGGGTVSAGGENSSIDTPGAATPAQIVYGWEHHPGHRELLLNPEVKYAGGGMDYFAQNEFARYVLLLVNIQS